MNIYTRAATPTDDSLEYRLLHLNTIEDHPSDRKIQITYTRSPDVYSGVHSYDEFNALPPGTLSAILTEYAKHPPSLDQVLYPSALFAAMAGAYVDVREMGHADAPYPLMMNIFGIKSSANPNLYDLRGYFFKILKINKDGVPVVKIAEDLSPLIKIEAIYLEKKWPGIVKALSIMESLGYDNNDIWNEIGRGLLQPAARREVLDTSLSFE